MSTLLASNHPGAENSNKVQVSPFAEKGVVAGSNPAQDRLKVNMGRGEGGGQLEVYSKGDVDYGCLIIMMNGKEFLQMKLIKIAV